MRKGNLLSFVLLALFVNPLLAQTPVRTPEAHAFTIQQCIEYAMKNNVQVKNALLDVSVQEQTNRYYTGMAYPQVSANLGSNYYPKALKTEMAIRLSLPLISDLLTPHLAQNGTLPLVLHYPRFYLTGRFLWLCRQDKLHLISHRKM